MSSKLFLRSARKNIEPSAARARSEAGKKLLISNEAVLWKRPGSPPSPRVTS